MLKVYCTECGSPTSYTSAKPKFCSACGNAFDKVVVNKNQSIIKQEPPKRIIPKVESKSNLEYEEHDDYDDNEEDINYVPDINGLDCQIEASKKPKIKLGDVIGTAEKQNNEIKIKSKKLTKSQQKIENKKFMEEWKREAGSLRQKSTRGRRDA